MYRKGVSALIVNNTKEFLLVNLVSLEEKYFVIPGGGVEEGESLEEAAYREIKEEVGIGKGSLELVGSSNLPVRFKFKVIKMNRDGNEYEGSERYFFGFQFSGGNDEIKLKSDEVRSCKWVPFYELRSHLLFDNQLAETEEKITELFRSVIRDDESRPLL